MIKPTKQEKNFILNKTSIEYHFKDRKEQKSRIGLGPNLNNTRTLVKQVYSICIIQLKT